MVSKLPWMCVIWPSFLAACGLEMLVFAWLDPAELPWAHMPGAWSSQAIYSLGFFVFWLFTFAASTTTAWLAAGKEQGEGASAP